MRTGGLLLSLLVAQALHHGVSLSLIEIELVLPPTLGRGLLRGSHSEAAEDRKRYRAHAKYRSHSLLLLLAAPPNMLGATAGERTVGVLRSCKTQK
jgi:hypothetical protein